MVFNFELLAIAIMLIWLIALTVSFFNTSNHYNQLVKGSSGKTLQQVLDTLLKTISQDRKDIDELMVLCDKMEKDSSFYIQKVGLLRFNPFKDTGGDQSFVLALTDKNETGIVISGIYSRLGTRWYAKKVVEGKGVEYDLSKEEEQAIKEAKSYKHTA